MLNNFDICINTRFIFGKGAEKQIGEILKKDVILMSEEQKMIIEATSNMSKNKLREINYNKLNIMHSRNKISHDKFN